MRLRFIIAILACFNGAIAAAKPLINSSEESYISVCIEYGDTHERLVEICQRALDQAGYSKHQREEMRDSLGFAYIDLENYDRAQVIFDLILEDNAGSYLGLKGLAWVAHGRENYTLARDLFQKSIDINPSAQALAGLGDSLWNLDEITVDEALLHMQTALALSPDYGWANRQTGWILIDAKRANEAFEHFSAFTKSHPNDRNSRGGIIIAAWDLDQYETVLEHANIALGQDAEDYWFLLHRTKALYWLDRYRQAIRDAERLIEIDPKDTRGYVWKARPLAKFGSRLEALDILAEAEVLLGQDTFLTYWRASILSDDNRFDEAITQIHRNTEPDTADASDFELLAYIQIANRDFKAARIAVGRASQLEDNRPYVLYYDAVLLLKEDQGATAAMARFDDAIGAGLSTDLISEFAGDLIEAGFWAHAIAIRAKY